MAYDQQVKRTINSTDIVPILNASPQAMTTGSITTATPTTAITATDLTGIGAVTVSIYGTFTGLSANFQGFDGTNWFPVVGKNLSTIIADASAGTGAISAPTYYNVSPLLGIQQFRVQGVSLSTGTANVIIEPSTQFVNNIQQVIGSVAISGTVTASVASTTITAIVPGVGATSLGKAEDAVHASGDTGVMSLAVRNDNAATAQTSANGDYSAEAVDINGTRFVRDAPSNTATKSNVAAAATSTTLLAANPARRSAVIVNESTIDCYISYGGTASVTSYTFLLPAGGTSTVRGDEYSGAIVGIWASATGNARITETSI